MAQAKKSIKYGGVTLRKKNITLLVLVLVLAVLCAGYVGVVKYKEVQDQKQQDASKAEQEANKIVLNQMDTITNIAIHSADGNLAFSYRDDTWHYDGDEAFPLNVNKINLMQTNLNPLEATRKLEEKEDLVSYGLTAPIKTVTITDGLGNEKTLNIGNQNEYSGDYYISVSGDDNVYTVGTTVIDSLNITLDDLLQLDTLPSLSESNITQIEWKTATDSVIYKKEERVKETEAQTEENAENESTEAARSDESQSSDSSEKTEIVWTETRNGTAADLSDSTKVTDAIRVIGELSISSCENYNVSEEQLAAYGLDEGVCKEVIITYNDMTSETQEEKTVTLHIGNLSASESSSYCVRVNDSKQVSRIAASQIDSIMSDLQQVGQPIEVTVPESE